MMNLRSVLLTKEMINILFRLIAVNYEARDFGVKRGKELKHIYMNKDMFN